MEKKMKKVCFILAIFTAMFLMVSCDGNTKLEDLLDTDANDTEAVDTDTTDPADTADTDADTDVNDTDVNDTDVNDTDVNDTDINDTDSNDTDVNDTDSNDTDPTNPDDPIVVDPCNPNQCLNDENSDGVCTIEGDSYSCGCIDDYLWYEGECKKVVTQSFCATLAQILGFEGTLAELVEAVCYCFSADQCVIEVEIEVEL